ncbi:MAG: GTP 3',8-cyclase MoaA [Candidatus Binatia bacterium]
MRGLTDTASRPLRDLRISVTDRCNFRCSYCMPAELFGESYRFLPRPELLSFEELERLVRIFVDLGVGKVRITGGEPLVRADLPTLVAKLAKLPGLADLALTTNGYLLADYAHALADAGLNRVSVSLDSLDDGVFDIMNGGRGGLARVLEGLDAAEAAGLEPIKINCVVVRGVNDGGIIELVDRFRNSGHVLRFIEYMDVGTRNGWELSQVVATREIVERIDVHAPLERLEPDRPGEVATRYRYRDGSGEIGVISSVSAPFCGSCNRARLSTDGRLMTCLFASRGTDLKGALRRGLSDEELSGIIRRTWSSRTDRYSEERANNTDFEGEPEAPEKIEMYQVGG